MKTGSGLPAEGESQGPDNENLPVTAGNGKRRSRRSTSAPTRLKQAAQLVHTAPAAVQPPGSGPAAHGTTPGAADPAAADGTPAGSGRSSRGEEPGILPQTAGEDDPRVWGDSPEDSSAWLLEQRPPHWG